MSGCWRPHTWINRLVADRSKSLTQRLLAQGTALEPSPIVDDDDGAGVLVDWNGRIANLVSSWFDFSSGAQVTRDDLGLEVDPIERDDPYAVPVTSLPVAEQKKLQAIWVTKACGCPLCRVH